MSPRALKSRLPLLLRLFVSKDVSSPFCMYKAIVVMTSARGKLDTSPMGGALHVGVIVIVVTATHVDQLDGGDGATVQEVVLRVALGLGIVQRLV